MPVRLEDTKHVKFTEIGYRLIFHFVPFFTSVLHEETTRGLIIRDLNTRNFSMDASMHLKKKNYRVFFGHFLSNDFAISIRQMSI